MKMAGMIKAKNELSYTEWFKYTSENIKKGQELHTQNVDRAEKQLYEQLQEKENSMVSTWKEMGYDQAQIDNFLDGWYKVVFRNRDKKGN
jgi:hypothetical protein